MKVIDRRNFEGRKIDLGHAPPWLIVAAGAAIAFLVFVLLDQLEQLIYPMAAASPLRFFHLARGFFSTIGGMVFIWSVMSRKESELVRLRDRFSEQLELRTEQLATTNTKLSKEVEQRKEGEERLKRLVERLAQSNASLEQCARVASHDLQEPLRGIRGYADLLNRRYKGKLDENADEFLAALVNGTQRMEELIGDILAHAKARGRQAPFEKVDCSAIIDTVKTNLSATIAECGAVITTDALPVIYGDKWQLVQLFQNLLSNAIKFRGLEAPKIHISATRGEREWTFAVQDNGIGIDPRYQRQVFEMFKRLHGRGTYPGTGIGLAICKTIAENHGGRIWFESQQEKGATFKVIVPDGA